MKDLLNKLNVVGGRVFALGFGLLLIPLVLSLPIVLAVNFVVTRPIWATGLAVLVLLINAKDLKRFITEKNLVGFIGRPLITLFVILPLAGLLLTTTDPRPMQNFSLLFWMIWRVTFVIVLIIGSIYTFAPNSGLAKGISQIYNGLLSTGVIPKF